MITETIYARSIPSISNSNPNFSNASGDAIFTNYSESPSGTLTAAQVETLVKGGVAAAVAQGAAVFNSDPTFSALFTNSSGIGEDGAFQASAESKTTAIASFSVEAGEQFSFDFSADLALKAKEIENPDAEYNAAETIIAFLLLDTANVDRPKIVDYFGIWGQLISSEYIGELKLGSRRGRVTIDDRDRDIDLDGNNGTDYLTGGVTGTFQRKFKRDTHLTLVEINMSAVELSGDTLIGNLGEDFTYGTIWDDRLRGSQQGDKIYGSLGDDSIKGKKGDDLLEGGAGDDELMGNSGADRFSYRTFRGFTPIDIGTDKIRDFQVGKDEIALSKTTFTALSSKADGEIEESEFAVVADDLAAEFSNAFIIYSTGTGNLFYNQNRASDGFGEGDKFAVLEGIPKLSATDFEIVA
jgi:serralysin